MRKPIRKVVVGVKFDGELTPLRLQAIAAKLGAPTVANLAMQVRADRMERFLVDLGDSVVVEYPESHASKMTVWIPTKVHKQAEIGHPATGEAGDKPAGETSGTQQEK